MPPGQLLEFIGNEPLYVFVKIMVDAVSKAKARFDKNPYSSVIDPFSAVVDASIQGISLDEWMEQEKVRRVQKALQNAVGEFHQNVLGAMPGWENAGKGGSYDVLNQEKKIIAEIKNKYNTLNSGGFLNMYTNLTNHLDYGGKGYTAYYVAIVTKNTEPYDKVFTPPRMGTRMAAREDLRMMDGKSFYAMASGDEDALAKLYRVLPAAIAHVLGRVGRKSAASENYEEAFAKMYGVSPQVMKDAPISAHASLQTYDELFIRAFGE